MDGYEATGRLRWLQKPMYRDMLTGAMITPRTLQQEFVLALVGQPHYEWRDVPTEVE